MVPAFAAPGDTPQLVIAEAVAAVEVADAVRAVIRRGQPHRCGLPGPARSVTGPDRERPELVEREAAHREVTGHVVDPVEFGVLVGVGGFLPGPRALEADVVLAQDLAQPLTTELDPPVAVVGEVGDQLAHAPVRERAARGFGSGGGRRDDERGVLVTDQAGTASRPLRVQRGKPPGVEGMDHIAHGVLVRGDQPGDRRDRGPGRRCHDHGGAADPDRVAASTTHDLGQNLALVIGQSSCSDRVSHLATSLISSNDEIKSGSIAHSPGGRRTACRQTGERKWSTH